jgi:N-acetylmuramoyl-L-alanine amidase
LKIKRSILFLAIGTLLFCWTAVPAWAKARIVVDAAHGGSDGGVKAGSQVEKDWNLRFAQALEKAFTDAGYDVVLIRKRDETLASDKRAEMINTSGASAVIILHADREWTGSQRGPMLVVEPPNRADQGEAGEMPRWGVITPSEYHQSLRLARAIAQGMGIGAELSPLSDSRGLAGEAIGAEGRIYCLPHQSLRNLSRPAVVLTPLFLTSGSDLKKFSTAEALAEFAGQVVRGTSTYLQAAP